MILTVIYKACSTENLLEFLPFHQFKIRFPMFTNWADEVVWDFFADVFVAADPAAPDFLAVGCGAYLLRLRFNVGLVVFVGAGWVICKDCHEGGRTDK